MASLFGNATLKGDSYRLKTASSGGDPPTTPNDHNQTRRRGSIFARRKGVKIQPPLTAPTGLSD